MQVLKNKIQTIKKEYYDFSRVSDKAFPSQRHDRLSSGAYTRALVDSEQLEWIELSATTEDQDSSQGGDGGIEENPLG